MQSMHEVRDGGMLPTAAELLTAVLSASYRCCFLPLHAPYRCLLLPQVRIDIVYSNLDSVTQRAVPGKRSVHASVRATRELGTWTGASKQSTWVVNPRRPRSTPSEFHLVERHRQGIHFQFKLTGRVYVLNLFVMIEVFVAALVTMELAKKVR